MVRALEMMANHEIGPRPGRCTASARTLGRRRRRQVGTMCRSRRRRQVTPRCCGHVRRRVAGLPAKSCPRICRRRRAAARSSIGAGKASAAMARAVEDHWPGRSTASSSRATATACRASDRDRRGRAPGARCGRRMPRARSSSWSGPGPDDLVLVPDLGRRLGAAGAAGARADARGQAGRQPGAARLGRAIDEMNCVRKHLSAIKGGRLAAAAPRPSRDAADLRRPGRRPLRHRLGPHVPDASTFADARAILPASASSRPPP